jgi:serine O-acetyltransferase
MIVRGLGMNLRIYNFFKHLWSWSYKILVFNSGFNDIARDAVIPVSTQFPHKGMGVVIGSGTRLGENVTIFQHVTTGNRFSIKDCDNAPVIEDDVVVFPYACILGNITVGRGSIIGAHSLVLDDVPPNSVVCGVPARVINKINQEDKNLKCNFKYTEADSSKIYCILVDSK